MDQNVISLALRDKHTFQREVREELQKEMNNIKHF